MSGTVGGGEDIGGPHGSGNTLSSSPFVLFIPDLLFIPPGFSASLCQRPQKFLETLCQVWKRWWEKGCLLASCLWGSLSWQPKGWRYLWAAQNREEEGQGRGRPGVLFAQTLCGGVAMSQHGCVVWGGRRDNLPEVLMLVTGLLAAGVLPGTVELPSILLEIRALALTQRAPKYIPGKGRGSTQGVTLGT